MYLAMYRARDYSRLKLQKRGLRRTVVHVYASATRELRQLSYVTIIFEKCTRSTYVNFKILRRFVWHYHGEPLRSYENGTTKSITVRCIVLYCIVIILRFTYVELHTREIGIPCQPLVYAGIRWYTLLFSLFS